MSRHNRDRRLYRCLKCRADMQSEIAAADARAMVAAQRAKGDRRPLKIVHQCPSCQTPHLEVRGGLRMMTAAERFEMLFEASRPA